MAPHQGYDAAMSFLVLTPLVSLFRHGTSTMVEQMVISRYPTKIEGALVVLGIGLAVEIVAIMAQAWITESVGQCGVSFTVAATRLYTYVVACANVFHMLGVKVIYKYCLKLFQMDSREMSTALESVVLSLIFLAGLQAVRNIIAIPLQVSLDPITIRPPGVSNEWFAVPTYLKSTPDDEFFHRLLDAVVTQGIVRTLVFLIWIAMRNVASNVLSSESLIIYSWVFGYVGVVNCWLIRDSFKEWSSECDSDSTKLNTKMLVEDVYIVSSMSMALFAWNGFDLLIEEVMYDRYKMMSGKDDITSVVFHAVAFVSLVVAKASRSLVAIGAELDATEPGGFGIEFDTAYFSCGPKCPLFSGVYHQRSAREHGRGAHYIKGMKPSSEKVPGAVQTGSEKTLGVGTFTTPVAVKKTDIRARNNNAAPFRVDQTRVPYRNDQIGAYAGGIDPPPNKTHRSGQDSSSNSSVAYFHAEKNCVETHSSDDTEKTAKQMAKGRSGIARAIVKNLVPSKDRQKTTATAAGRTSPATDCCDRRVRARECDVNVCDQTDDCDRYSNYSYAETVPGRRELPATNRGYRRACPIDSDVDFCDQMNDMYGCVETLYARNESLFHERNPHAKNNEQAEERTVDVGNTSPSHKRNPHAKNYDQAEERTVEVRKGLMPSNDSGVRNIRQKDGDSVETLLDLAEVPHCNQRGRIITAEIANEVQPVDKRRKTSDEISIGGGSSETESPATIDRNESSHNVDTDDLETCPIQKQFHQETQLDVNLNNLTRTIRPTTSPVLFNGIQPRQEPTNHSSPDAHGSWFGVHQTPTGTCPHGGHIYHAESPHATTYNHYPVDYQPRREELPSVIAAPRPKPSKKRKLHIHLPLFRAVKSAFEDSRPKETIKPKKTDPQATHLSSHSH